MFRFRRQDSQKIKNISLLEKIKNANFLESNNVTLKPGSNIITLISKVRLGVNFLNYEYRRVYGTNSLFVNSFRPGRRNVRNQLYGTVEREYCR